MADADAQRLSPRGRDDPSFLGGGAHLRPSRPRTGPPKRRHPRAAVESVRPDAGGPAGGLGRATELPVTTRRDGRTEMAVLAEGNVRWGIARSPRAASRRCRKPILSPWWCVPEPTLRDPPPAPGRAAGPATALVGSRPVGSP